MEAEKIGFYEGDELVRAAEAIGRLAHAGQRYGEAPYVCHLADVHRVLCDFARDRCDLLAAAWLHDALEDTSETAATLLAKGIPGEVVDMVNACTDGSGRNRAVRKERPFTLIPQTPDAVIVKLADRIANAENARRGGKASLLDMYRKEHAAFRARLCDAPSTVDASPLWKRLEEALAPESP